MINQICGNASGVFLPLARLGEFATAGQSEPCVADFAVPGLDLDWWSLRPETRSHAPKTA